MEYDVFVSHASEDKDEIVRPLATQLELLGLKVWFDECQITLGDNLRQSIDRGLIKSRFGVVILSPAFLEKTWTQREIDGLFAREENQSKVILPVWHRVNATDIVQFSPIIAGKVAISTDQGLEKVANSILEAVKRNIEINPSVKLSATNHEKALLRNLRAEMLIANSSWQLRENVYKLDAHLSRYPHSHEARLLKDQMVSAMIRTEAIEIRRSSVTHRAHRSRYGAQSPKSLRYKISHISIGPLILLIALATASGIYLYSNSKKPRTNKSPQTEHHLIDKSLT